MATAATATTSCVPLIDLGYSEEGTPLPKIPSSSSLRRNVECLEPGRNLGDQAVALFKQDYWPRRFKVASDRVRVDQLGKGMHGKVYRLESPSGTGEMVALKLFNRPSVIRPDSGELLAKKVGSITHLQQIRGFVTAGGRTFNGVILLDSETVRYESSAPEATSNRYLVGIMSEYVEGEDLSSHTKGPKGKMSLRDLWPVIHDLGKTLINLHIHGAVHRDVKPDNILLSWRRITLIDLGNCDELGSSLGLPPHLRYGAPERILDKRSIVGIKEDAFSFGATLTALVLGRVLTLEPVERRLPQRELVLMVYNQTNDPEKSILDFRITPEERKYLQSVRLYGLLAALMNPVEKRLTIEEIFPAYTAKESIKMRILSSGYGVI